MAGLLDTTAIQDLFGSVFGGIYGSGQLIRIVMTRQTDGTVRPVKQDPVSIKVQVDVCTEEMRRQPGYTDRDVRLLILQSGISGGRPGSDDIIIAQGDPWKVYGVTEDPGRSYWEMRGVRQGDDA